MRPGGILFCVFLWTVTTANKHESISHAAAMVPLSSYNIHPSCGSNKKVFSISDDENYNILVMLSWGYLYVKSNANRIKNNLLTTNNSVL